MIVVNNHGPVGEQINVGTCDPAHRLRLPRVLQARRGAAAVATA
jgi:hypothetical protein